MPEYKVFLSATGQTIVGSNGEQVAEAQINWFLLFIENLVKVGIDPLNCDFEFPNGVKPKIIKTETGYNYSF